MPSLMVAIAPGHTVIGMQSSSVPSCAYHVMPSAPSNSTSIGATPQLNHPALIMGAFDGRDEFE